MEDEINFDQGYWDNIGNKAEINDKVSMYEISIHEIKLRNLPKELYKEPDMLEFSLGKENFVVKRLERYFTKYVDVFNSLEFYVRTMPNLTHDSRSFEHVAEVTLKEVCRKIAELDALRDRLTDVHKEFREYAKMQKGQVRDYINRSARFIISTFFTSDFDPENKNHQKHLSVLIDKRLMMHSERLDAVKQKVETSNYRDYFDENFSSYLKLERERRQDKADKAPKEARLIKKNCL